MPQTQSLTCIQYFCVLLKNWMPSLCLCSCDPLSWFLSLLLLLFIFYLLLLLVSSVLWCSSPTVYRQHFPFLLCSCLMFFSAISYSLETTIPAIVIISIIINNINFIIINEEAKHCNSFVSWQKCKSLKPWNYWEIITCLQSEMLRGQLNWEVQKGFTMLM